MKFKKLISVFLAASISLTMTVPTQIISSADTSVKTITQTYVNPLYADTVSEDDIFIADPNLETVTSSQTYTTVKECANYLRAQMKKRSSTISMKYSTTSEIDDELLKSIYYEAVKHTGNSTEGDYLSFQMAGWSSGLSYTYNGKIYDGTITYKVTYYTSSSQETKVTAKIKSILDSLDVYDGSDYEKVKAVYDYLCKNVVYDYDHLSNETYYTQYTAYAALINKTSVCQGYAVSLYRMLLELGVDCRIVSGTANGGPHAWNIVKLNNKYYNLDATWDAVYKDHSFFLKCNSNFDDHSRDSKFKTTSFNNSYPMGSTNYKPGDDNSVASKTIKLSKTSYTYTGTPKRPAVTITGLKKGTDFTVSYSNNVNAGTATVTVKGIGKYKGKATKTFKIVGISLSKTKIGGITTTLTYTGKAQSQPVKVVYGTKTLVKNTDYTVSYSDNKYVGKATMKITGKGNYRGTITKTFTINPKKQALTLTAKKKGFLAEWKLKTQTTGYQLQYSVNKSMKGKTSMFIKNRNTLSQTITGLTSGETYYVRVRIYKKVGGVNYYGAWSTIRSAAVK